MSRDLMYPNDKHNRKMITFSSMSSNMEEVAAEISVRASSKFVMEEDIAEYIKKVSLPYSESFFYYKFLIKNCV